MLLAVVGCVFAIAAPLAAQATPGAPPPPPPPAQGESPAPEEPSPLLRKVSLDLHGVPLGDALKEINRQARLGLAYSQQLVPVDRPVTIRADSITAGEALRRVLDGTGVQVQVGATGTVFLVKSEASPEPSAPQRPRYLGGQVVDSATHQPLSGVQIFVRNTSFSAVTNEAGVYNIRDVPPGRYTVTARLIGYSPVTATVTVTDSALVELSFMLRQSPTRLTELVTTATGPRRRVELGNDITIIDADSVVRNEPVASVTDLLDGRVPGLVVQRTSGVPGDPGRLRLRGTSGVLTNNDPIVVVDGVRIYSQQSGARGTNLANSNFAAPSPINQIDPHSIETIEVLKGPSAATLYGADAANGVIVITTKKGRAGPAQWSVSADRGTTFMPGGYPDAYLRFGHRPGDGTSVVCPLTESYDGSPLHQLTSACVTDSIVQFQALNDPDLTVLNRGARTAATVGVTGGGEAVQYSVTANYEDVLGLVQLPALEVDRYQLAHHGVAAPDWMLRPDQYTNWGVTSRLTAKVSPKADVSLTAMLTRDDQRRSTLEQQLSSLMGTYIDRTTGRYYTPAGSILQAVDAPLTNYYTRVTENATTFTNGLNFTWRPLSWLTASADAGINVIQREAASLLPRGATFTAVDSAGRARAGKGTSVVSTVNLRSIATVPLGAGFRLQTAVGANYVDQRTADVVIAGENLPLGGTSVGAAGKINGATDLEVQQATFGWYVEPTLAHKRFWLSMGLRLDGGNSFGSGVRLFSQPKVSPSWLISDEPWFPLKDLFNTLRLRAAYGKAGVQPGPADRLRLYNVPVSNWVDGQTASTTTLKTFGNTQIRPERSTEFEAGLDADLLADRLTLTVTGYRKTRTDALLSVPVPPSVYGGGEMLKNIGVIRNTGFEMTLGSQVVRSNLITWGMQLALSHNRNMVVSLAPGVDPFFSDPSSGARVAAGFPLNGKWGKPIVGYEDVNGDGILASNEVLYGDSLVYIGPSEPDYTAAMSTTLSLFRGTVNVIADFGFNGGLAQTGVFSQMLAVTRGMNDPATPLSEQAAVISALAGDGSFLNTQTVSMLRFNSLAVQYNVPGGLARRLGARALSVSLQGTNLGLISNYRGKDPGVNGAVTGNFVRDNGVLPLPRTWQVRVSASY
jgi:TonB-linked SusC/RagA family outer membrane protein